MQIPQTTHKKVIYRNGEEGYILTTQRRSLFPVMTLRIESDSLLYHKLDGKYLGLTEEHVYDIVEIEK